MKEIIYPSPDRIVEYNVLLGVRKKIYSDEELKEWIRHGKIREFKRQS